MDHHYCGCGVCRHCKLGWSQLCREGFVVYGVTADGAHADYMKVPARTLVPLPDESDGCRRFVLLEGAGHMAMLERPIELDREIRTFARSVLASGHAPRPRRVPSKGRKRS